MAIVSHSGDSLVWLSIMVVISLWQEGYWRDWALTMIVAMLAVGLVVKLMKMIWRSERPEGDWGGIYRRTDPYSFPSGHAARAGLLLTMAIALGPVFLAVFLVAWAPLVCYSRVFMRLHVPFEVVCGFFLGVLSGLVINLVSGSGVIDFRDLFS